MVCTDDTPKGGPDSGPDGHGAHLKDKATRFGGRGPDEPYSRSKIPCGGFSLKSASRAQSGGREKRELGIGREGGRQKNRETGIKEGTRRPEYKMLKGDQESDPGTLERRQERKTRKHTGTEAGDAQADATH